MVRWDNHGKRTRNEAIVEYKQKFPNATLNTVGLIFGISKQRVSQILKRERDRQKHFQIIIVCAWCGKEIERKPGQGKHGISHGICQECLGALDEK